MLSSEKSIIYNATIDMWAYGCTFYEVLHIEPMFSGPMFKLIQIIGNVELREFTAACPREFKNIIMKCFEARPANRPDALDLLEVVEEVRFEMKRKSTNTRLVILFNISSNN